MLAFAATADAETSEDRLRELDQASMRALAAGDIAALDAAWSDEFTVHTPNNMILKKQQVLDAIRDGQLKYVSFERTTEEVFVYGDLAATMGGEVIVTGATGLTAGKSVYRRYTNVWRLENGQWKVVIRHSNDVPAR